jgi:PAS domain S-box-containing protein
MSLESTIAERRRLLELLVSRLDEFVVVVIDIEGRFASWHPGVLQELGYEAGEFIGVHMRMLFPEPDRSNGTPERELQTAAVTGKASDTRWLVHKQGRQILVEGVTLALKDETGQLLGFGKVIRNVTERRATEERLKTLTSALEQSTVFIRTIDGIITHWTKGCERMYGWTASEAVGQVSWGLLKTIFPQPVEEIEQQLAETGVWQGELGQTRRDGTYVYVSADWVMLSDSAGQPLAVICTHTDITGRV